MPKDNFVALTYGPSGVGKSTDAGFSFPRALFLAAPGALHSVEHTCGYTPTSAMVPNIEGVTEILKDVSKRFDTVVIDDFSFMAEQTFVGLEKKFQGFKLWGELRDVVMRFRDESRYAGVNVVLTCWEGPPKVKPNGAKIRGGPMLSGNLPEQIPALCDIVLRASSEPARKPWPTVYRCNPADPNWVMKDRFDVAPHANPAPMNLAELLRAAGVHIDRHPDNADQEKMVETISGHLSGDPEKDVPTVNEVFKGLVDAGKPYALARWTVRDAFDRAIIRRSLKNAKSLFIS